MERNLLGKEYIPQYLKSLIYIDYTDKDIEANTKIYCTQYMVLQRI